MMEINSEHLFLTFLTAQHAPIFPIIISDYRAMNELVAFKKDYYHHMENHLPLTLLL